MCGVSVVKGYAATRGRARDIDRNRVDFPALGNPMKPACAMVRISRNQVVESGSMTTRQLSIRLLTAGLKTNTFFANKPNLT